MERREVDDKYKWKTSDIFSTKEEWLKLYTDTEKMINFDIYRGKLGDEKTLFNFYKHSEEVMKNLDRIYLYAQMQKDVDNRVSEFVSMQSKAQALAVKLSMATSFAEPELTALSDEKLKSFLNSEILKDYDYSLKRIIEQKPHILSEKEEELIATGGEVYSSFKSIFAMIDNADLPFPMVVDKNGEKIEVTHGMYGVILHSSDRDLRKKAFKKYYKAYINLINTISQVYYGNVKKDVFMTRIRNYDSCLDRALSNEDVSKKVYEKLISKTNEALPLLHRYIKDRKGLLNLKTQHMYDIYAPIVEDVELKLDYEKAYELVIEGLKPLGENYGNLLKRGATEGWIDVAETTGKVSGAYSTGIYGLHPYVLLNYQKTTNDIFTIAHEMGHSIHTYFSNENQPYSKADYTIFVAEVASTVNEVLLIKHILAKTEDKNLKKYLLSYFLDMIRTTLFRQTMFAEFEYIVHDMVEHGEPLTKEIMCESYLNLNKKYYGEDIVSDEEISYEWARIPHFYNSFYVYKYSTGIISALSIARRILSEGEVAVNDYFEFLKSGGKDSPVELLKLAGVDLSSDKPFDDAFMIFKDILEEFENI